MNAVAAAIGRVAWGRPVTGITGDNERCIEVPLALEVLRLTEPGWVLDAGCALNGHLYVTAAPQSHVVHITQAIGSEKLRAEGREPISYISADLRDLRIIADGAFDRAVCVSTLEHIGMDNRTYGGTLENDPDSAFEAFRELLRVTHGPILVTVPGATTSWMDPRGRHRFFSPVDVGRLARLAGARWFGSQCYRKADDGWRSCEWSELPPASDPVFGIVAVRLNGPE